MNMDVVRSSLINSEIQNTDCCTRASSHKSTDEHQTRCRLIRASTQSLNDLRLNNLFCDAVIRLEDGVIFPVHRAILSVCSNYFRTLFTTTLHVQDRSDFYLPCINSKIMRLLLEYAYLYTVNINSENVIQLLISADYLSMLEVLDHCCDFLREKLCPENCINIMLFTREHFCSSLEKETRKYVLRNFVEVTEKNNEILLLPFEELLALISDEELNVKYEETVWELVVRWIDHDPIDRKRHVVDLMNGIRLGLLNTQYFLEKVKDHIYVSGNEACRPLIIETLKFLCDLEMMTQKENSVVIPVIARPRIPHEILFAIGGRKIDVATNFIEVYDTRADRWVKVREIDPGQPRAYHGTVVIGHDIYVIGGLDGKGVFFRSCRCFNAVTKTWKDIAPMITKRAYASVVVLNDIIYAVGGFNGYIRHNSAEQYDYRKNKWSFIAPMNVQRSDSSAAVLNGKIYVAGGFNGRDTYNTVEVYDPEINQWTMIAPMRVPRSGLGCVAYHGCIYALGGFNNVMRMRSGEKYSPATNTWTAICEMYNPRSNYATAVIDDMIFVMGGYTGSFTMYYVECYNEKTNEWCEVTEMNLFRSGLSACVVKDLPNIRDYIYNHREHVMEDRRQRLLALEAQRIQLQQLYQQQLVQTSNQAVHQFVLFSNRRQARQHASRQ